MIKHSVFFLESVSVVCNWWNLSDNRLSSLSPTPCTGSSSSAGRSLGQEEMERSLSALSWCCHCFLFHLKMKFSLVYWLFGLQKIHEILYSECFPHFHLFLVYGIRMLYALSPSQLEKLLHCNLSVYVPQWPALVPLREQVGVRQREAPSHPMHAHPSPPFFPVCHSTQKRKSWAHSWDKGQTLANSK